MPIVSHDFEEDLIHLFPLLFNLKSIFTFFAYSNSDLNFWIFFSAISWAKGYALQLLDNFKND